MRPDRALTLLKARLLGPGPTRAGAVPVLMYHSVSHSGEPGVRGYYRVVTSPARFREHMRVLAEQGFAGCGLDAIIGAPAADGRPSRPAVITFDDGYVDFLEHAWPVLEELSFTASMFLPTAYVGETARRTFKGRECLTWPEVRDLHRHGIAFGSHTVTHPELYRVGWAQVRDELRESRERIQSALGAPVTTFAFPFAFPQHDDAFVDRLCRELREQGYCANVTTQVGRFAPGDDPLRIKRLPVNECDDEALFTAKLVGAYDWVGVAQAAWKRLG